MNKYLVVEFDRYETTESSHKTVEAKSPVDAYTKVFGCNKEEIVEVDAKFSCVPGEESDILIFKI